ncbi:MAG TPA: hypothetical protein VNS88_17520 [Nitrospiraceae bacterium]|nr:hypothetical protein [Nitrospiraceae bacterium]
MTMRKAKLVPWYHVNKDRCEVNTMAGDQCKNSASFTACSGLNGSTEELPACKPHADILEFDPERTWRIKPLLEKVITI